MRVLASWLSGMIVVGSRLPRWVLGAGGCRRGSCCLRLAVVAFALARVFCPPYINVKFIQLLPTMPSRIMLTPARAARTRRPLSESPPTMRSWMSASSSPTSETSAPRRTPRRTVRPSAAVRLTRLSIFLTLLRASITSLPTPPSPAPASPPRSGRSFLLRRRLAAVSAAALDVGTARLLRHRVSSLPPRARSRFVAEWDDCRGLAPA